LEYSGVYMINTKDTGCDGNCGGTNSHKPARSWSKTMNCFNKINIANTAQLIISLHLISVVLQFYNYTLIIHLCVTDNGFSVLWKLHYSIHIRMEKYDQVLIVNLARS